MVLEGTDFNSFYYFGRNSFNSGGIMVLKELIFNSFYFGRGCWALKGTDF